MQFFCSSADIWTNSDGGQDPCQGADVTLIRAFYRCLMVVRRETAVPVGWFRCNGLLQFDASSDGSIGA